MSDKSEKYDCVIIGSGPAGLTAAIYTSRGGLKTLVLTGHQPGGQPTITDVVENFPGFPDGIKGPELMARVEKQAKKFGAELEMDEAVKIKSSDGYQVKTRSGKVYSGKTLIIATGASPKWLDVPGADKFKGRGISTCATCDGPLFKQKTAAVIGGGDTALTEAEFLAKFADRVFVIHRRENLRTQQILQERVKKNSKINLLYNSQVNEFFGEERLAGLKLTSQFQVNSDLRSEEVKKHPEAYDGVVVDKNEDRIRWKLPVDGVFLAVGYNPNTGFLDGFVKMDDQGYIKTDREVFTSLEGVFAAGDCVDYRYRQNIVACGMGCKAALEAENFLNELT